jgi:predicted DNA-binding transcriptional regulator YafY
MTDRLERLVNLVIALRETYVPLTAAEIRTKVAGYGQDDPEAFRRMFERDKADLRALGVPIDTEPLDRLTDERQGYRIDPRRYDLPALAFQPDELLALALAVDVTGLSDTAVSGMRKLEVDAGRPGLTGLGVRSARTPIDVPLMAPHLDVLAEAQLTRTSVRFPYRSADGRTAARRVDPHALVHRRGHWYLVGHDHDRDDVRAFRLDRITGNVRTAGQPGAFPQPAGEVAVDAVVPEPPQDAPATAVVDASPDVAWMVARRARGGGEHLPDGWVRYTVPVGDPDQLVGWALEHAGDVVLREPRELHDRAVAFLRRAGGMSA